MQEEDGDIWLLPAKAALLHGLLVGLALVVPGLVVHACFSPVSTALFLSEAAFDLAIGLFVVAPAAFVERLSLVRPHPPIERRVAIVVVAVLAFVGAMAAFLQGLYASVVLRTGSLDEGFAEVTRGAGLVVMLEDLLGLFACIAFVVATFSAVETNGPRPPGPVLTRCIAAAAVVPPFVLVATGLRGPQLVISITMLLSLAVLLPLLASVADRLAGRRT